MPLGSVDFFTKAFFIAVLVLFSKASICIRSDSAKLEGQQRNLQILEYLDGVLWVRSHIFPNQDANYAATLLVPLSDYRPNTAHTNISNLHYIRRHNEVLPDVRLSRNWHEWSSRAKGRGTP